MILVAIDDEGRPAPNTLPLVGIGYDSVVRKVYNLIKRFIDPIPALTHEDAVNLMLFHKGMEFFHLVVDAPGVNIHDGWKVRGLDQFV